MTDRDIWETNADDPGRPKCTDCRFYRRKGDRCQRYPPTVFYDVGSLQTVCRYPNVGGGMWCGEFASRLVEP